MESDRGDHRRRERQPIQRERDGEAEREKEKEGEGVVVRTRAATPPEDKMKKIITTIQRQWKSYDTLSSDR